MPNTPSTPLPVAAFLSYLRTSGLLAPATLDTVLAQQLARVHPDGRALALELIKEGTLTRYQAGMLLLGRVKGLVLGNYLILDKIGAGGMGMVFLARHRNLDRVVAVKVLPPEVSRDSHAVQRFHREVQAVARVSHANIVAAYDADEAQGVHFLVMEYVEGADLARLVRQNGLMAEPLAVACIVQAAQGLGHAHAAGIVHRDVKPSNLLLDLKGIVKVLDLGLARLESTNAANDSRTETLTESNTIVGTIDYMAPEQAINTHTADQRADVYSLGCTLFFLLTGKPPYRGATALEKLLAHRDEPIPDLRALRPDVSAEVVAVFRRMVAKKPEQRYPTMSDVVAALEMHEPEETSAQLGLAAAELRQRAAQSPATDEDPFALSHEPAAPLPGQTSWPLFATAGLGTLLLVGLIAWFAQTPTPSPQPPPQPVAAPSQADLERKAAEALNLHFRLNLTDPAGKVLGSFAATEQLPVSPFRVSGILTPRVLPRIPEEIRQLFFSKIRDLPHLSEIEDLFDRLKWTPSDLANLPQRGTLTSIEIGFEMTPGILVELKKFPRLRKLLVAHADDAILLGLALQHPGLEELTFGPLSKIGPVTVTGIKAMTTLPNLQVLSFFTTKALTLEWFRLVGQMPRLEQLRLTETNLDDAKLGALIDALTEVPKLQILQIRESKVTDAGLGHVARIKSLRELYVVEKTEVSETGVKTLAKSRPDLKISWGKARVQVILPTQPHDPVRPR